MSIRRFTGRTAESAWLDAVVADASPPPALALVSGTAGVGKTALVVAWAHRVVEAFPDGQLYVDVRGYSPEQPVPGPTRRWPGSSGRWTRRAPRATRRSRTVRRATGTPSAVAGC
jgi:hypothetical protein